MVGVKLTGDEARSRQTPVQESLKVQHKLWLVERLGVWWMLAMVLLTVLGLFSKGLLSSTHARSTNGSLSAHYERFLRNGASSLVVLEVHGQPASSVAVNIDGDLLDGLTVESITPPPTHAGTYAKTGFSLQLNTDAQGTARVHLSVRADGVGQYRSVIHSAGDKLPLNQFIYP